MANDVYAVAVIGIRHSPGVIGAKLFTEKTQRGCEHIIKEDQKYCPECGAPAMVNFPVPIKEYDADEETLCGFDLVERYDGNPEFIAFWASEVGSCMTVSVQEILGRNLVTYKNWNDLREDMKAKLEPLGLYEGGMYGLHVFLRDGRRHPKRFH